MAHEQLTPIIQTSISRLEQASHYSSREAIINALCVFVLFDTEKAAQCSFRQQFSRWLTQSELCAFEESVKIRLAAASHIEGDPFLLTPLIMECL